MLTDLDIYGVYLPGFFAIMLAAYLASVALRFVAGRLGLYAYVWHRALFDLAVYVLILGAFSALFLHSTK